MQLVSAAVSFDHPNLHLTFTKEVKVNKRVYQQSLKRYVLPWLPVTFGSHYVFTEARAETNTDNTT